MASSASVCIRRIVNKVGDVEGIDVGKNESDGDSLGSNEGSSVGNIEGNVVGIELGFNEG